MTRNTTVKMPGGNVEFDIAVGRDKTPWKGYATDVPGLLVARLPRYHTISFGDHEATYRPATVWGIFHRGTGMRVLWLNYKTRREATHRINLLRDFDWSEDEWPDVTAEQLARILNPTREQELEDRVTELERRLQETREVLHEIADVLIGAHAELTAMQSEDRYVVVNTTRGPFYREPGECFVMPGEDTHTFSSIERAAHCVLDMVLEHGHDLESARIFHLTPVPERAAQKAFFAAVKERKEEVEEWYPNGDAPLWLSLSPVFHDHPPACAHCFKYPMCSHRDEPDYAPNGECAKALAVTGDGKVLEAYPWPS